MKRFIYVLTAMTLLALSLFPVCAKSAPETDSFGAYKHVIVLGIDGAGAAFEKVDTPEFDRIFGDGAFIHDAHTEDVTVSAQNWGSILCGVSYDTHGFENNYIKKHSRTTDSENNSIFAYVRKAYPESDLVSVNDWSAINKGIIETDINVKKINRRSDVMVTHEVKQYFESGKYNPVLTFIHFDSVDHAGHSSGGFSEKYYTKIKKADALMGEIYDSAVKSGLMDDGLFILVADHGETYNGHGGNTKEESSAVVAVAGKTVNKCKLSAETRNRDVASLVLHALGVEQPENMTSVLPDGVFGEEHEINKTAGEKDNSPAIKIRDFAAAVVSDIWGFFTGSNS